VSKEPELWQFIATRLELGENVMLLVVAESSGSSPGRQGYKMAIGSDGELIGSIGGGVMEVALVEQAKAESKTLKGKTSDAVSEQVHRKDVPNSSGMICSGRQTVLFKGLTSSDLELVNGAVTALAANDHHLLTITPRAFSLGPPEGGTPNFHFEKLPDREFVYRERLGPKNELYVIGGGHCALALSELMSKMNFHISIFDDRPELNTVQNNTFADSINTIESYDRIVDHIPSSPSAYVVVMTLGYKSDAVVIRSLIDKEFKYFGVLGSKAKMATLMKELRSEGLPAEKLDQIRTPIGVPINSHTPEEIAVSIAAEIISIKNA
jgi:xanthine dehydrogenase accessory factor